MSPAKREPPRGSRRERPGQAAVVELFRRAFHRGSNVRQVSGAGLGLEIVGRCVELHGGGMQCQSAAGEGTVFTVRLPLFAKPSAGAAGAPEGLDRIL